MLRRERLVDDPACDLDPFLAVDRPARGAALRALAATMVNIDQPEGLSLDVCKVSEVCHRPRLPLLQFHSMKRKVRQEEKAILIKKKPIWRANHC
jgi:hypothetical protein